MILVDCIMQAEKKNRYKKNKQNKQLYREKGEKKVVYKPYKIESSIKI